MIVCFEFEAKETKLDQIFLFSSKSARVGFFFIIQYIVGDFHFSSLSERNVLFNDFFCN